MNSKIADAIKVHREPVAVLLTDHKPENALEVTEERGKKNRCIIPLFVAAVNGRTAVLEKETVLCPGGQVGLCFAHTSWAGSTTSSQREGRENLRVNTERKRLSSFDNS